MTNYHTLTVVQLKQILTERNLPVDGLKQDLIDRLEANDQPSTESKEATPAVTDSEAATSIEPAKDATPVAAEPTSAIVTTETPATDSTSTDAAVVAAAVTAPETAEPTSTTATTETVGASTDDTNTTKTEPLSPEEMKKLALDYLNKKLHRANKFGSEPQIIDEINKSINRIEKFGLDLQNPLAIELGLVKPKIENPKTKKNNNKVNKKKGIQRGSNTNSDNRHRVRKGGYSRRR